MSVCGSERRHEAGAGLVVVPEHSALGGCMPM